MTGEEAIKTWLADTASAIGAALAEPEPGSAPAAEESAAAADWVDGPLSEGEAALAAPALAPEPELVEPESPVLVEDDSPLAPPDPAEVSAAAVEVSPTDIKWQCRHCGHEGPPDDFGVRTVAGHEYRQPWCRPCRRGASKASREKARAERLAKEAKRKAAAETRKLRRRAARQADLDAKQHAAATVEPAPLEPAGDVATALTSST